jgi:hypothetical protein
MNILLILFVVQVVVSVFAGISEGIKEDPRFEGDKLGYRS